MIVLSIRGRVVLLVLAAQFLAISCAVGISVAYIHRALWAGADERLHAHMIELLALVDQSDSDPHQLDFDSSQLNVSPHDFFLVEDEQGRILAGDRAWIAPPHGLFPVSEKSWQWERQGHAYRAAALWHTQILDQDNYSLPRLHVNIFYAMRVDDTREQIAHDSRLAALSGLFTALLSALLTWWAVGRGMLPLTGFARYADHIEMDGALTEAPADVARNSELIPLARALASLEERVHQALRRERQFLSDAAHELKTAVAIEKSTLQLLEQRQLSIEEYRRGVSQAIDDALRIERLVHDMLLLSSLEHARHCAPSTASLVKLGDTAAAAIDQLAPVAQLRSVTCVLNEADDLQIRGNEADLTILWTNLLENAIRHAPQQSIVQIGLTRTQTHAKILITDAGSGISSENLPHLFERFFRSDDSRSRLTGGFGLGLSIAKAIVENHGGSIRISSPPGNGATVEVLFPLPRAT